MARETMTSTERMEAAYRLEKPDRVPVAPVTNMEMNASFVGMTQAQVANSNDKAVEAALRVWDDYGGWDGYMGVAFSPVAMQALGLYPLPMRIPGKNLPDDYMFQLVEKEVMKVEDYDKIIQMGFDKFYYEDYLWRITDMTPQELPVVIQDAVSTSTRLSMELAKRGLPPKGGGFFFHPFFTLSLMRSMVRFTEDLYYRQELVEKALKRMTDDLIPKQTDVVKKSGGSGTCIVDERASGFYYPLSVSDRFWWPYSTQMVEAFWSEGILTSFHLDTPWTKNIPRFKMLPKGACCLLLDSTTDIFAAKELLRGHTAFYGDVSAALLSIGKPEDVVAYVKKLIDKVGDDGGFILGTGCAAPPNTKPENFRALVETGKTYEFSKR